jgi:hypothetical protein
MRFPLDAEELLELFTGSELRPLRVSCVRQFADAMVAFARLTFDREPSRKQDATRGALQSMPV